MLNTDEHVMTNPATRSGSQQGSVERQFAVVSDWWLVAGTSSRTE